MFSHFKSTNEYYMRACACIQMRVLNHFFTPTHNIFIIDKHIRDMGTPSLSRQFKRVKLVTSCLLL